MSTHVLACAAGTVLLLSACATSPHGWARSDTPHTQVAADKAQCEYEAKKATASYSTTPTEEDR